MKESSRVRMSGPLAACAPELIICLADRGYQDHSAVEHVRRLAHVSRWLEREHLDHEQMQTTQIYLHGDLSMKERALARTAPPKTRPGRYRPPDPLMAFLEGL